MPLYCFDTAFGVGVQVASRTVYTDARITPVLPVVISVGGAAGQRVVLRANYTVVVFAIHILPPLMAALHCLGALIGRG